MYASRQSPPVETQTRGDFAVLNYDDPTCRHFAERRKAQVFWFSATQNVPHGVWLNGEQFCLQRPALYARAANQAARLAQRGERHGCCRLAHLAGAKLEAIGPAVASFPGVEHRIEFVRDLDGVEYYNDSKATNVDASLKAIDAFRRVSGSFWAAKIKVAIIRPFANRSQRAKGALLIGAEPPYRICRCASDSKALAGAVELSIAAPSNRRFTMPTRHASSGDIVLLLPPARVSINFKTTKSAENTLNI